MKKTDDSGYNSSSGRYFVLLLLWLSFFLTFCYRLLISDYSHDMPLYSAFAPAKVAEYLLAFYAGYVMLNLFSGFLCDYIGKRKILIFSLIGMAFSGMLIGGQSNILFNSISVFVLGCFSGLVFVPSLLVINEEYRASEKPKAIGLFMTATSLSIIVSGAAITTLIPVFSFHSLSYALAFICMLCVVALLIDGKQQASEKKERPSIGKYVWIDRKLLLIAFVGFFSLWGSWGFILMLPSIFSGLKIGDTGTLGLVVLVIGGGSILGKVFAGHVYHGLRISPDKQISAWLLLTFTCLILLMFIKNMSVVYAWAVMTGLVMFSYITPLNTLLMAHVKSVGGRGAGLVNAIWQMGSGAAPFVASRVSLHGFETKSSIAVVAIGPLVGALATILLTNE